MYPGAFSRGARKTFALNREQQTRFFWSDGRYDNRREQLILVRGGSASKIGGRRPAGVE